MPDAVKSIPDILEPVKLPKASFNFCDLNIWERVRTDGGKDFMSGDRIYAVDAAGTVIGKIVRPRMNAVGGFFDPVNGPSWGAMLHVYGNDPATLKKDGPDDGEEIFLRWSGLQGFGYLETTEPIIFRHWGFLRAHPVLP